MKNIFLFLFATLIVAFPVSADSGQYGQYGQYGGGAPSMSIMIDKTADILLKKGFNEDQIYISAERLMYCGIGKCGRCMIHGKYTCLDGAVFRYDELRGYKDD